MAIRLEDFFVALGLQTDSASFAAGQAAVAGLQAGLGALADAVRASVGALADVATSAIAAGDEVAAGAVALGLSTREYQELAHVAEIGNSSIDALGRGLVFLQAAATDAGRAASSEAGRAFAALGVDVRDANDEIKSGRQLLGEVSAAVAGLPEGAQRIDLVRTLFGRGGAELLPVLTSDIGALSEEAQRLGIVLSDDTISAGADLDDQLVRLRAAGRGLQLQLGQGLLPVLTDLARDALAWANANREAVRELAAGSVRAFGAALRGVFDLVQLLTPAARALAENWKTVAAVVGGVLVAAFGGATVAAVQAAAAAAAAWIVAAAPVIAVGVAIAGVLLALEDVYQFLTGGQSVIEELLPVAREVFAEIGSAIRGALSRAALAVEAAFAAAWAAILGAADRVAGAVLGVFRAAWLALPDGLRTAIESVVRIYAAVFAYVGDAARAAVGAYLDYLRGAAGLIADAVTGVADAIAGAVSGAFRAAYDAAAGVVREIAGVVTSALSAAAAAVSGAFAAAWNFIGDAFDALIDRIRGVWRAFAESSIVRTVTETLGAADRALGSLSGVADTVERTLAPTAAPALIASAGGGVLQQRNEPTFVTYAAPGQDTAALALSQREQWAAWQREQVQGAAVDLGIAR